MRDQMQVGDGVLFYASNADPSGVTGLAEVSRAGYPDHTAWKKGHKYLDEASTKDKPIWFMVDISFVEAFPAVVPLDVLKATKGLEDMMVTQKGSRLSVQPVKKAEFDIVVKLGRRRRRCPSRPSRLLDQLTRDGDLVTVDVEVDANQEAAEIHRRVIAAGGPALRFTNVRARPSRWSPTCSARPAARSSRSEPGRFD